MSLTKEQALAQIDNLKKFVEDLDKPKLPELINGHWYQPKNVPNLPIYIYCKESNGLVDIITGYLWRCNSAGKLQNKGYGWKDVTNDYKLVKI